MLQMQQNYNNNVANQYWNNASLLEELIIGKLIVMQRYCNSMGFINLNLLQTKSFSLYESFHVI